MHYLVKSAAAGLLLALAGCGGGGGGSGSSPPPSSPPPPTASTPVISTQPASVTVGDGSAASFQVVATANGTLSYAWRMGGAAITGATSATYSIAATTAASAGSYDCVITNTLNGTASTTSSAATLTVIPPATITLQPAPVTVLEGSLAVMLVQATGPGTITYAWRRNGTAIAGATGASYVINSAYAPDAGNYDVVITHTLNGVSTPITSNAATLTVLAQPTITAETAVAANSTNNFASTTAVAGITFAWTVVNGTITSGQDTAQIQYTAGSLGAARVSVTLNNSALPLMAVKEVRVVSSLPVGTLFAPPIVHTRDSVRTSASALPGLTYTFSAIGSATGDRHFRIAALVPARRAAIRVLTRSIRRSPTGSATSAHCVLREALPTECSCATSASRCHARCTPPPCSTTAAYLWWPATRACPTLARLARSRARRAASWAPPRFSTQ